MKRFCPIYYLKQVKLLCVCRCLTFTQTNSSIYCGDQLKSDLKSVAEIYVTVSQMECRAVLQRLDV